MGSVARNAEHRIVLSVTAASAAECPAVGCGRDGVKSSYIHARLQKMQNPITACAAAPRSLQTLARAGSRRAASGRSLKTLGQSFSS